MCDGACAGKPQDKVLECVRTLQSPNLRRLETYPSCREGILQTVPRLLVCAWDRRAALAGAGAALRALAQRDANARDARPPAAVPRVSEPSVHARRSASFFIFFFGVLGLCVVGA